MNQNTSEFFVANQSVNRVDIFHHECVETWYPECHKVCIGSDVASVYIMNILKSRLNKCNDVKKWYCRTP